jgi:hypothetical protein
LEKVKTKLRNYSGDSPYFAPQKYEALFAEVNQILVERFENLWQILIESDVDFVDNAIVNFHVEKFRRMCLNVLQHLDKEGVFGVNEKRLEVVVSYLTGDIDPSAQLLSADILNPPQVYKRLKSEVDAAMNVSDEIREYRNNARKRNDKKPE